MALKQELLELEQGFWNAAGDRGFYEEHFADNGVAVFPFKGGILDAGKVRDSVESGVTWKNVEFLNVHVIELAPQCAALIYEAVGSRDGQPDYHALLSSVYVRDDGAWQMVVHQQTPLPE